MRMRMVFAELACLVAVVCFTAPAATASVGNPTTTTVTSSLNPSGFGQPLTFTATISGLGTPTGTVTFQVDFANVATVGLVNGQATFTTSTLGVGNHAIGAAYIPNDASFLGSAGFLTQVVNPAPPTTNVYAWIGLKNSDDVGTKFEVKAEVTNGTSEGYSAPVAVPAGSSGFNNAKLVTIPVTNYVGTAGQPVSVTISVRVACNSGHTSGTARLWWNDKAANSKVNESPGGFGDFFLTGTNKLRPTVGSGPKMTRDVLVKKTGCPNQADSANWQPFGTWTLPTTCTVDSENFSTFNAGFPGEKPTAFAGGYIDPTAYGVSGGVLAGVGLLAGNSVSTGEGVNSFRLTFINAVGSVQLDAESNLNFPATNLTLTAYNASNTIVGVPDTQQQSGTGPDKKTLSVSSAANDIKYFTIANDDPDKNGIFFTNINWGCH